MASGIAVLSSLAVVVVIYFVVPWLLKAPLKHRTLGRLRRAGYVCLTFDDGPDPDSTPQILDLLAAAGARATFFVLGSKLERHPDLASRIVASGHELGEHGFAHLHAWRTEPIRYVRSLLRGRRSVLRYLPPGSRPPFRPTYGELNALTLLYAWLARRRLVLWDIDPRDFEHTSPADIAAVVIEGLTTGSVVLLHDGREESTVPPQVTVEAVRRVLEHIRRHGLRAETISRTLADG